jgi:hypothetical protein
MANQRSSLRFVLGPGPEKLTRMRVRPAGAPLTGTALRGQKVAVKQAEPIF